MPRPPEAEDPLADTVGNAVRATKMPTGEIVEDFPSNDGKDKTAEALGRKGGRTRAESMTPEHRAEKRRPASE